MVTQPVWFNGLNRKQRNHISAIMRRRDFLARRLAEWAPGGESARAWVVTDLASLNWALTIIENAAANGTLRELEQ